MTKAQWKEFFLQNKDFIRENRDWIGSILGKAREFADDEMSIDCNSGASKLVLIDTADNLVLKWAKSSSGSDNYDESYAEYEIYRDAVEKGLDCFFPKTEILIDYKEFSIVVQERIKYPYCETPYAELDKIQDKHKTVPQKIINKATRGFYDQCRTPRELWIRMAISYYGKKKMKELGQFTKEHQINDLHAGNVGFSLQFAPIILDFSGYHRSW